MAENYLANTPLILTADDGTPFRVERGEVVELSDAQYEQVAAHVTHVTVIDQDAEDEAAVQEEIQAKPASTKRSRKATDKAE